MSIWLTADLDLKKMVKRLEAENAGLRSHQACTKRAEQAEAEVRKLRWMLSTHLYDDEVGMRWDYGTLRGELPVEEVVRLRMDDLATRYKNEYGSAPEGMLV